MRSTPEESGPSRAQLLAGGWALGVLALVCVVRLVAVAAADVNSIRPVHPSDLAWLAVGFVAAVFSACCAVVLSVKSAEARVTQVLAGGVRSLS